MKLTQFYPRPIKILVKVKLIKPFVNIWCYDNECGGIENAYPLSFQCKTHLDDYMESANSHGHLDQFPTRHFSL